MSRPIHEPDSWPGCGLSDPELLSVVDSAARKLATMTDADFLETAFIPAYPVLYDEGETEDFAYGK